MPLYEYRCCGCNAEVEILIRNSEQTPRCPECGEQKLEKQLSLAAAPAVSSASLPVCPTSQQPAGGCGRPQCGTGCMFE